MRLPRRSGAFSFQVRLNHSAPGPPRARPSLPCRSVNSVVHPPDQFSCNPNHERVQSQIAQPPLRTQTLFLQTRNPEPWSFSLQQNPPRIPPTYPGLSPVRFRNPYTPNALERITPAQNGRIRPPNGQKGPRKGRDTVQKRPKGPSFGHHFAQTRPTPSPKICAFCEL
jgi:hypothetical protein